MKVLISENITEYEVWTAGVGGHNNNNKFEVEYNLKMKFAINAINQSHSFFIHKGFITNTNTFNISGLGAALLLQKFASCVR